MLTGLRQPLSSLQVHSIKNQSRQSHDLAPAEDNGNPHLRLAIDARTSKELEGTTLSDSERWRLVGGGL